MNRIRPDRSPRLFTRTLSIVVAAMGLFALHAPAWGQPQLGMSVVFNEIYYVGGPGEDYVELYNRTNSPQWLGDLVLTNGVTTHPEAAPQVWLEPGGIQLWTLETEVMSNLLYLERGTGATAVRIDQLGWLGGPGPSPGSEALIRLPDGAAVYQGAQGANWHDCGGYEVLFYGSPTPGAVNRDPRHRTSVTSLAGGSVSLTCPGGDLEGELFEFVVAGPLTRDRMDIEAGFESFGQSVLLNPDEDATASNGFAPNVTTTALGGCLEADHVHTARMDLDSGLIEFGATRDVPRRSPDINGDGVVDLGDIAIFSTCIGTVPGMPDYDPCCDLNDDQFVDLVDIVEVGKHVGHAH